MTAIAAKTGKVVPPLALEVAGLTHRFGSFCALNEASLSLNQGDFTVLLGLNGAGKTTLYSLITRLYSHQSGSIHIFGHDLYRHPSAALARIGVVFQQPSLDMDLSVEQNLRYHASLHGIQPKTAQHRIDDELQRCGLAEKAGAKLRTLSGGQRRRVEIARALLHQPSLLLLDEPTVGLDIGSRQAILQHIHELCRSKNLAVLWATHLIDEIEAGGKVVILHQGQVLAAGPADHVVAKAGARDIRHAFNRITGLSNGTDDTVDTVESPAL